MRLLFSSMLLASLCAPVSQSASVITQNPDVSVMEGEAVKITCCWSEQGTTFKVNWLKNQTEVKYEAFVTKQDNEQKIPTCSSLTFESIRREVSGKYTCRLTVEIPTLTVDEGTGTIINVTTKDNTTTTEVPHPGGSSSTYTPVIVLTAVAPLILIAIICYCKLRRKKGLSLTQNPDVSIMEGEAANITCCWPGEDQRSTMSWRKNQTAVKYETVVVNTTKQDSKQKMLSCSSLTFRRVHSGKYTCTLHVEIP